MKNVIEFYSKEVYGLAKFYVAEPKMAAIITKLTGRKTLLDSDFEALEALGFTFKAVLNPSMVAPK